MSDLEVALRRAAAAPTLLVVSDFDGTLAPIIDDPEAVEADREAVDALNRLSELPDTHAAILSGRSLVVLRRLARPATSVILVGGHGGDTGAEELSEEQRRALGAARDRFAALLDRFPDSHLEEKGSGVAFHYRPVAPARQPEAARAALEAASGLEGVRVLHGKKVVEVSAAGADKGTALDALRRRVAAEAVVFIGDDVTDEDAFGVLAGADVGVKVGSGPTAARYRVEGPAQVPGLLLLLESLRAG